MTGREEIWRALRMVVEMMEYDLQTAQEIVNASGITVPTGRCASAALPTSFPVDEEYAVRHGCGHGAVTGLWLMSVRGVQQGILQRVYMTSRGMST